MASRRRARPSQPLRPPGRGRRWLRRLLVAAGLLTLAGTAALGTALLWAVRILPRSLPSVDALQVVEELEGTSVYDGDDRLIAEFRGARRQKVPLHQIPDHLKRAVIATEDHRFYTHWGIDPLGILRAVWQNYRSGRIVEGGSTITQQLAKVLFLTPDKSLDRKLREAALALEIERRYSKDRILEMYLNQIYFGNGAYGVEAAAQTYFGKPVADISVAEAALLAGLPRAPAVYSPFHRPDAARGRRDVVLRRLAQHGALTAAQAAALSRTGLGLVSEERRRTTSQYFLEHVRHSLEASYGADAIFKAGLKVYTTLDPRLQLAAEQSLREGLGALEVRTAGAKVAARPEGAVVTIDPATGHIKALVGGYDFFRSEFNRALHARRQPGSAFKPFVFVAALENGLTSATTIDDAPVSYPHGRAGKPWEPGNYDRTHRGPTTLQHALEQSVNVVTVKVQERVGVERTIRVARRLGVSSPLNPDLTLALGSSDVSLLELTSAYGAFANQGAWVAPIAIRHVMDARGRLLEEQAPEAREAMSPEVAYVVTHMLRGAVERGTGRGAQLPGRVVAGKTGTTNDYSNAWFVGYTPQLVTGVWVGYDRPRSLGTNETSARVAVPIWARYMARALQGLPAVDFAVPGRVLVRAVDLEPGHACARAVPMAFVAGTEPATTCGAPGGTGDTPQTPGTRPAG